MVLEPLYTNLVPMQQLQRVGLWFQNFKCYAEMLKKIGDKFCARSEQATEGEKIWSMVEIRNYLDMGSSILT